MALSKIDYVALTSGAPSWTGGALDIGSGNLNFSSTAQRITGDFSNATIANRLMFQNSVVNANTNFPIIPNGTATQVGINLYNNSDPTNASSFNIISSSSENSIRASLTGTGTFLPMTFYTSGSERMRIDTSGNVGIGTNSPLTKLNVKSSTDSSYISLIAGLSYAVRLGSSTAAGAAVVEGVDITGTASYQPLVIGGSLLQFTTSSTERMRIDSSGNLLVGKTGTALTSNGWTFTPNTGSNYCFDMAGLTNECFNYNNTGTGTYDIAFRYQATVKGYIRVNSTNTTYSTTSDYRLKENIVPMTGALDKVLQLKPVTYTWKTDGSDGQGFIAHELQEVVPECVNGEKDAVDENGEIKPQGVDTSFLVATLTAAIQELKAEFEEYKAAHP